MSDTYFTATERLLSEQDEYVPARHRQRVERLATFMRVNNTITRPSDWTGRILSKEFVGSPEYKA